MSLRGKIFLFLTALLLLAGCSAPQIPATPSPIAARTPKATREPPAKPSPTSTLLPSPTYSPTPIPEPPLTTSGPYLAYFRQSDRQQLVLMDPDGTGRKVTSLPSQNGLNRYAISPNGRWLAYYLGSAINEQAPNLTLNLLDLKTGNTLLVSRLLSRDYPNNFVRDAKKLKAPAITPEQLQQAFLAGITNAVAWSPDGAYLAFAGEMDGPSSDVYLYELKTGIIQRKSIGRSEIQWIGWSPDGKWIVYSSVYSVGQGMTFELYSTTLTGQPASGLLTGAPSYPLTSSANGDIAPALWINDHQFLAYDSDSVAGDYGLRVVDVAAGSAATIWTGNFTGLVLDPQKQWAGFFSGIPGWPYDHIDGPDFPSGAYLVGLVEPMRVSVAAPHISGIVGKVDFLSGHPGDQQQFVATASNVDDLVFVSTQGTVSDSGIAKGFVSLAPDLQHWLVIGNKIRIYSAGDQLVREVSLPAALSISEPSQIIWRPDSSGLFLVSDASIYALDLLSGGVQLVETNLDQPATFTWVGQK